MGLMERPTCDGRLVVTPHPVTLEGQTNRPADLRPGESLYAFLQRHVDGLDGQAWHVTIGGVEIPREHWHRVRPKDGQVIEVRAAVGKGALALIATVALAYFTFGTGSLFIGAGAAIGGGVVAAAAVYVAGSIIINKVLGPRPTKGAASDADSVYSLRGARNRARPYQPLGLLFGNVRIAPDLASNPYTWYEGDEQYLGMVLTPGLNVHKVDPLYNGEALLSTFEGVRVWNSGFAGMTSEDIPLYSNVDTLAGGELDASDKGVVGPWVQRTSSPDTIRLQVDIEYLLFDTTTDGKPKNNQETFQLQYRATGSSTWLTWGNFAVTSRSQRTRRVTYGRDVEKGQYDVRVRIAGNNTNGKGATARFTWSSLTSVQADEATYAGIPRIGIRMRASGQLSGAPDELRCVAWAKPIPVWKGSAWVTEYSSNPGAQILQYARGIYDPDGNLVAGLGLSDSRIDIDAIKAFMLHCAANNYTYDNWITEPRSHDDVLDAIALAGFGQKTWAGGKLSVVWAADEQPLSGVVNMATIKRAQFQVDYTLVNGADGIEFTYLDRTDWRPKTLRVAAPGVTTMLNPAQVEGEGITSEAHAARMARWHLAQSLFQYKDIRYSTNLEHLSYRRLSVLALQHDLTQWGYGGRLASASASGGVVTLQLDEEVPSPSSGKAYIGLRIPGEGAYRVFEVATFSGPARTLVLADEWPEDAPLPGSSADNPAWDTLWVYDFKQTPGYRVRVVGIEPEDDLKGAAVSVVPEGPEFWTYVLTGEYIPPNNPSLLQTRPVASNVQVSEAQVVEGNTVVTELTVTFEVTGPVGVTVVSAAFGDEPLEEVAQTFTRTATWRLADQGTYAIHVRPYAPDGTAGVVATTAYTTAGAGPPPAFDWFAVYEPGGGIRRYSWGYHEDTIQPANLAGAEIRYIEGNVVTPSWAAMTQLSGPGYYTTAFDAVAPPAGVWTFAIRARNTSGELSAPTLTTVTLSDGLPAIVDGIQSDADALANALAAEALERFNADAANAAAAAADATAKADAALATALGQVAVVQAALDQEVADRVSADLATAQQAAADATAKADAALATALGQVAVVQAQVDTVAAQVGDIISADEWSSSNSYVAGDLVQHDGKLYRAKQAVPAGTATSNTTYWELLGNYTSLGEAVAASLTMSTQNASDIAVESSRIDAVVARMPSGTGTLATASAVNSLDSRVTSVEGTISSQSSSLTALTSSLNDLQRAGANMIYNGDLESYANGTVLSNQGTTGTATITTADKFAGTNSLRIVRGTNVTSINLDVPFPGDRRFVSGPGRTYYLECWVKHDTAGAAPGASKVRLLLRRRSDTGVHSWPDAQVIAISSATGWTKLSGYVSTEASTREVDVLVSIPFQDSVAGVAVFVDNVVLQDVTDAYNAQQTANASTTAISSLGTRVTAAEGTITSQGNAITALQNSVTNLDNNKADASALNSLDSRVTAAEGSISSTSSSVTSLSNEVTTARGGKANLNARLNGIDADVASKASAAALTSLESRVTSAEGVNTSQGSAITALQNSVTSLSNTKADASALNALESIVEDHEDQITSQGSAITGLQNSVTGLQNSKADASALNALDSRVTSAEGQITAQGNAITSVQAQVGATGNFVLTPNFAGGQRGTWGSVGTVVAETAHTSQPYALQISVSVYEDGAGYRPLKPGDVIDLEWDVHTQSKTSGDVTPTLHWRNKSGANGFEAFIAAAASAGVSGWQYGKKGSVTVPAGAVEGRLLINYGTDGGTVKFTNVRATVRSPGVQLLSAGVQSLETRVTSAEGTLTSQGTAITALQNAIPGKADASAVTLLEGRVDAAEDAITANSSAITTVSAQLGGGVGGNMLVNPSFKNGSLDGWNASHTLVAVYGSAIGTWYGSVTPGAGARLLYTAPISSYAAVTTRSYSFGASVYADGPWDLILQWFNSSEAFIGETVGATQPANTDFKRATLTATPPAGSAYVRPMVRATNTTSHFRVARPKLEVGAFATPYSEELVTSANASAISTLDATVTSQGDQITANASAITALNTDVGGAVSAISALQIRGSSGGNLMRNANMGTDLAGYTVGWNSAGIPITVERNLAGNDWRPTGRNNIGITASGNPSNSYVVIGCQPVPVTGGKSYILSVYVAAHRCRAGISFVQLDASGENLGETYYNDYAVGTGGTNLNDWTRLVVQFTALPNARLVRLNLWQTHNGGGDAPYTWFTMPMIEEALPGQTQASPWSAGGEEYYASYTLSLDVNGYVSGFQSSNTGQSADFTILADNFRIMKPGGGARTEFSGGNWRVYDASGVLRVRMGVW